jgi:hypothetical protein
MSALKNKMLKQVQPNPVIFDGCRQKVVCRMSDKASGWRTGLLQHQIRFVYFKNGLW